MVRSNAHLGELLVQKGKITNQQLHVALGEQLKTHYLLGETLIYLGAINGENDILPSLAQQLDIDFISLKSIVVPPEVIQRMTAKAVNFYKVFPIKYENGVLTVAMNNPGDTATLDDLVVVTHARIPVIVLDCVRVLCKSRRNLTARPR